MIPINEIILRGEHPIYIIDNSGNKILFEYWNNDFEHYKKIVGNFNIIFRDLDLDNIILNTKDLDSNLLSIMELDIYGNIIYQKHGDYEGFTKNNEDDYLRYHKDIYGNELNIEFEYDNNVCIRGISKYTYVDDNGTNGKIIYEYRPNGTTESINYYDRIINKYLKVTSLDKDYKGLISQNIINKDDITCILDHEYEVNDGKYITHSVYNKDKLLARDIYYMNNNLKCLLYKFLLDADSKIYDILEETFDESDIDNILEETFDESDRDKNILYYQDNKGNRTKFIYLDGFYRNPNYVTYLENYNTGDTTYIEYNKFNKVTRIENNGKLSVINEYDKYGNIILYTNYDDETYEDYEKWEYLDGNSNNDTLYEYSLDGEYFYCEKRYDNNKRLIYYKDSDEKEINIVYPIIINQ